VKYSAGNSRTNKVVVTRSGNTVTFDDRVKIKAGTGCKAVKGDTTKVRCTTKKAPTGIFVYLKDGNDSVRNNAGVAMYAAGGMGNDSLIGRSRADNLRGEEGNDTLYGLGGNDTLDGYTGNDVLYGGDGNDGLYGWWGNDILHGGNGDDSLQGLDGNDQEYGDAGSDGLIGGRGSDRLEGGAGNDALSGDDPREGAVAADVMLGGPGRDAVDYQWYSKAVTVDLDGAARDDGQSGEHDTVYGDDLIFGQDAPEAADHLDGGANATAGDESQPGPADTAVNCER
jgi:serralysin